jgi:hypothetical protein
LICKNIRSIQVVSAHYWLFTCVFSPLPDCLYQDELQWASAWLYRATKDSKYLDFLQNNQGGSATEFSWDNKYPGAQLLATQVSDQSLILHAHPKSQLVIIHQ